MLQFFRLAGRLKETSRAGWLLQGIRDPESVADHTFRVCLLALVLAKDVDGPIDVERCLTMALIHDLAESIVGDITPHDGIPVEEKNRREGGAMKRLSDLIDNGEILSIWEEYQAGATPEARFVKELDKLETVLQAAEYEEAHQLDLQEFWEMGERSLVSSISKEILDVLSQRREFNHERGDIR
ncbi:MAG: HD domain-containing protein [Longimicrobiaceae bacterium]